MKLNINISNFGKIKNARLEIKPFTVIAGRNSSGKSFVTKALYSFFSTINKDFVTSASIKVANEIQVRMGVAFDSIRLSLPEQMLIEELLNDVESLNVMILQTYGENTFSYQIEGSAFLVKLTQSIRDNLRRIVEEMSEKQKFEKIRSDIDKIFYELKELIQIFERPASLITSSIQREFTESLRENFQVTSLSALKNFDCESDSVPKVEIEKIGSFSISGEVLDFSLQRSGIDMLQDFSSIVYLESPIYWRLKNTLERVRDGSKLKYLMNFKKQDFLSGVPREVLIYS